jgi:hypothetical protein
MAGGINRIKQSTERRPAKSAAVVFSYSSDKSRDRGTGKMHEAYFIGDTNCHSAKVIGLGQK